jgi:hypothetical protein
LNKCDKSIELVQLLLKYKDFDECVNYVNSDTYSYDLNAYHEFLEDYFGTDRFTKFRLFKNESKGQVFNDSPMRIKVNSGSTNERFLEQQIVSLRRQLVTLKNKK